MVPMDLEEKWGYAAGKDSEEKLVETEGMVWTEFLAKDIRCFLI